jgi:hypothetical protein
MPSNVSSSPERRSITERMSAPNLSTILFVAIPSVVVGGAVRRTVAFRLQPVLLVPDPRALGGQPFAGGNGRRGTDNSYKVAMAGGSAGVLTLKAPLPVLAWQLPALHC